MKELTNYPIALIDDVFGSPTPVGRVVGELAAVSDSGLILWRSSSKIARLGRFGLLELSKLPDVLKPAGDRLGGF